MTSPFVHVNAVGVKEQHVMTEVAKKGSKER